MRASRLKRALGAAAWLGLSGCLWSCSLLVENALDENEYDQPQDGGGDDDKGGSGSGRDSGTAGGGDRDGGGDSGTGGSGGSGGDSGTGGSGGSGGTGGDSGTGGDGGPVDSGADGTAPDVLAVVNTSPGDDSNTTYFVSKVELTFSTTVNAATGTQVIVSEGDGSAGTGAVIDGALSTDGAKVTFTFDAPLRAAGSYHVHVEGITGTGGEQLAEPYMLDFSIVPGFPGDAQYIDRNDTPGGELPEIAVDAHGNALAVWLQKGAGGSLTSSAPWYAFYTYGQGWDTPRALDTTQGHAFAPKVAMAPSGAAVVAWMHWSGSTIEDEQIKARQYLPASGWQDAVTLDSDPDTSIDSHHVAVAINASGKSVVAWLRGEDASSAGSSGLGYIALGTSDGFGSPVPMLRTGNPIRGNGPLDAAIDSAGVAAVAAHLGTDHAMWKQQSNSADWVQVSRQYEYTSVLDIAATVDASDVFYSGCHAPEASGTAVARGVTPVKERIDSNVASELDPQLAISADTDAVAAWIAQKTAADTVSVRAVAYTPADDDWALTASDIFPDRGNLVPSGPDVAVYLGSSALVAWPAGGELYTVERDDATGYGAATPRENVSAAVQPGVRVAASKQLATGVMVWVESNGVDPARIAAQSFRGAR